MLWREVQVGSQKECSNLHEIPHGFIWRSQVNHCALFQEYESLFNKENIWSIRRWLRDLLDVLIAE